MTRGAAAALVLALAACARPAPPGDPMGTWAVHLTPVERVCSLDDVPGEAYGFEVVLTEDPATTTAWVTLGNYSRTATWDGQAFSSVGEAPRIEAVHQRDRVVANAERARAGHEA